jgi:hypothetical protein
VVKESNSLDGGNIIVGLLGITFIVLKLCHVINWSWWWVTLPFWGSLAIAGVFVIFMIVVLGLVKAITTSNK